MISPVRISVAACATCRGSRGSRRRAHRPRPTSTGSALLRPGASRTARRCRRRQTCRRTSAVRTTGRGVSHWPLLEGRPLCPGAPAYARRARSSGRRVSSAKPRSHSVVDLAAGDLTMPESLDAGLQGARRVSRARPPRLSNQYGIESRMSSIVRLCSDEGIVWHERSIEAMGDTRRCPASQRAAYR